MDFKIRWTLLCMSFGAFGMAHAQTNTVVAHIQYMDTKLCGSDSGITNLVYYIRPDILRLDVEGPYANSSFIYQPTSGKVWVLYRHDKVFFTIIKEDILQIEKEVAYAKNAFAEKIAAEKMAGDSTSNVLWQNGNPLELENLSYGLVKKRDSLVSQLLCKKYLATRPDGSQKLIYFNNLKTTGIDDKELEILTLFNDFMGNGTKVLAGSLDFTSFFKRSQKAYPILIENRTSHKICNQLWLKSIGRQHTSDDLYKVPVEFGKLENPLGHRR